MMLSDVKDEIMKALKMNSDRFKPGNEVKKKVLNWALVSRTPPKAPNIVLPQGPLLTEKYINDLFKEEARINFMAQNMYVKYLFSLTILFYFPIKMCTKL